MVKLLLYFRFPIEMDSELEDLEQRNPWMIDCRLSIDFVVAIRIVSRRWSSAIFFLAWIRLDKAKVGQVFYQLFSNSF